MSSRYIIAILIVFAPFVTSANEDWRISSIKTNYNTQVPIGFNWPTETEIEYINGHIARTEVVEFEVLAFVTSDSGVKFILFKGRECAECDMRTSLYISAVSEEIYKADKRYALPGKLFNVYDGEFIEDSRMFYGKCLKPDSTTIVWFINYLGEDSKWHKSVYDVDFDGIETIRNTSPIDYNEISKTEQLVAQGLCREVWGGERTTEP